MAKKKAESTEQILESIRDIIATGGEEAPVEEVPVLELTEMVNDDGSVTSLRKEDDVLNSIDEALSREEEKIEQKQAEPQEPETMTTEETDDEPLISEEAAQISAASLKNLAKAAEMAKRPAATASPAFRSGATLEDLAMEAIRPHVKEWLDSNLPRIVEEMVAKEIKKLAS